MLPGKIRKASAERQNDQRDEHPNGRPLSLPRFRYVFEHVSGLYPYRCLTRISRHLASSVCRVFGIDEFPEPGDDFLHRLGPFVAALAVADGDLPPVGLPLPDNEHVGNLL